MNQVEQDLVTVSTRDQPLEKRVAAGARLWDLSQRAKDAVEVLKIDLRREAIKLRGDSPGATTLEGVGMTRAVVTFPRLSLRVQPGVETGALKQILGERLFYELFEEVYSVRIRNDSFDRVGSFTAEDQKKAASVLLEFFDKPRVSFQYGGEGITELGSE